MKKLNLKKFEFDNGKLITCHSSSENGCNPSYHLGILSNSIDEIVLNVISQDDIPKKERDKFLDQTKLLPQDPSEHFVVKLKNL